MPKKKIEEETSSEISGEQFMTEEVDVNSGSEPPKPAKTTTKKPPTAKKRLSDLDMNELIDIKSCCYGELFYSSKAGYSVSWPDFGSVQPMPVSELIVMRNEQPAFFKNNWVVVDADNAEEIIYGLQLDRLYTNLNLLDNFDNFFDLGLDEMKEAIGKMTSHMKEVVARRAHALIETGELDSMSFITMLEAELGFELR